MELQEYAANVKIHANLVTATVLPYALVAIQVMYSLVLHALNVLYNTVINVILQTLPNVSDVLIISISIHLENAIYAMMDVKAVMKLETAHFVLMVIIYLDTKMAQWFVKVASLDVAIVNIGQVSVQNVIQDFTLPKIRHAVHVSKGVGNVVLFQCVSNAMKVRL